MKKIVEYVLRYFCLYLGVIIWKIGFVVRRIHQNSSAYEYRTIVPVGGRSGDSIFFKELVSRCDELLGTGTVVVVEMVKDDSYFRQLSRTFEIERFAGVFIDTRTFSKDAWHLFLQLIEMAIFFSIRNVKADCLLTDASLVKHRLAAIFLTARKGSIVTFLLETELEKKIPHRRLICGSLIPISIKTIKNLEHRKFQLSKTSSDGKSLKSIFVGSLYPERMNLLNGLQSLPGLDFQILSKDLGLSNQEYWEMLSVSDAVIVTTAQTNVERNWVDLSEYNQVTFRIAEVFASGSALVCQRTQGIHANFQPGVHYFEFTTSESLRSLMIDLIQYPSKVRLVAEKGHTRFCEVNNRNPIISQLQGTLNV